MAYSTIGDLAALMPVAEILQVADDDGGLGRSDFEAVRVEGDLTEEQAVLRAVLLEAIDQADREIDGYVALVRAVPMVPTPPLLANLSGQLACWYLHARRGHRENPWDKPASNARRILRLIGEGKLKLGQEVEGAQTEPEPVMESRSPERIFGSEEWAKW